MSSQQLSAQPQQQKLQHRKLSQQNSVEKQTEVLHNIAATGGPQTIADLQQKLLQLTSQPSESLNVSTPPISHPLTPHGYAFGLAGYETYMHSLQQKFANISVPVSSAQSLVRLCSFSFKNDTIFLFRSDPWLFYFFILFS